MSRPEGDYADVAVPVPVRRLFTYRVGESLRPSMQTGLRVRVPFGRRQVVGTVVKWPAEAPATTVRVRAINSVADGSRLPPAILELTRFVADYYLCSWGEAIEAALPPAAGRPPVRRLVRRKQGAELALLPERATRQRRLLSALPPGGRAVDAAQIDPALRRALPALLRLDLAEVVEPAGDEATALAVQPMLALEAGPRPTPAQAAVLARLQPALGRDEFAAFLLYGVTGSGKTEVYFRAAREMLERGRGVLYLVPEIGLTPLLLSKIASRLGQALPSHSGLSRRERSEAWEQARAGQARLVVGTRSAIFAPIADLGLIVVDEEQDGSYKQQDAPRYNARDLAVVRAQAEQAVLLLGSATPSLESFRNTGAGRYELLRLGGRVEQRPLARVHIVDMRLEYQLSGGITPLSRMLLAELRSTLERGEQALVLRNRRGWAVALFCPRCGHRFCCEHCSIALTWHRAAGRLRCHYCGLQRSRPDSCAVCGNVELKLLGEGSEHIEDLVREAVPAARVARMDRDTVRGRGAHERLLRRFERREIDILVGTQMIAKGHDFHGVTLVGVLSADQSLGLPDFRAAERAFQLLTQVAGRAGRGERPGTVVVQAFEPDHPLLRQAAEQDYEAFFEREMSYRRALRYPPLSALVQLVIQDREELKARQWAELLAQALREEGQGKLLLGGPAPAPLERLRGRYRQQILVRASGRRRLIGAVERALGAVEGRVPRAAIQVDVDPYSLL